MKNFQILKNKFRNKRVLITGHTGFKGSWLTQILLLLNSKIMGISLPVKNNYFYNVLNLEKNIIHKEFDLSKNLDFKKFIIKFDPHYLFHLAAQSLVINSIKDPYYTFRNNINSSLNILESAKQITSLKSIIFVSSDKCYNIDNQNKTYKETDQLGGGLDSYSISKASNEFIFKNYLNFFKEKNIGAASVRAGNVIGGGDFSEYRLIPDLVRSCKSKIPFIFRDQKNVRPWQHVLDCMFGYILLSCKLVSDAKNFSGCWNFGPSSFSSSFVAENLVNKFLKKLNYNNKIKIIRLKKNKFEETKILKLNTSKIRKKLKYENSLNINETVNLTADWYKLYLKRKSFSEIKKITIDQIINYTKKIKYKL